MFLTVLLIVILVATIGGVSLPFVAIYLGYKLIKRLLASREERRRLDGQASGSGPASLPKPSRSSHKGCPRAEAMTLRQMERRLEAAHRSCQEAMERRLPSEMARSRVAPPLEDAYSQIRNEIASIYAFCERNDLAGTLKKANQSMTAKDIYEQAYLRDIKKVQEAIEKTEECLAAYERTVATLEVSSIEADISSGFDASIEMLRELRKELPLYSLEDNV